MSKYDLHFKRLALLLLPTFLRQPLMAALTYASVSPLSGLHVRLQQLRRTTDERLRRNGQVCHLRATVNDVFDPSLRRIDIADPERSGDMLRLFARSEDRALRLPLPPRSEACRPVKVERRGFVGIGGYDFQVCVPRALRDFDEARLRAVVGACKLASKRFTITYK